MDLKWGVLLQIIQKACADPVSLQACGDWFKGSVLGERLLGLAEELCEAGLKGSGSAPNRDSWALISLALSQHHNNGETTHTHTHTPIKYLISVSNKNLISVHR